ncbi:MAG: YopX family protein [Lachnospira sp.]|nr:YopX family protein [Lachnospira sp.]
MEDKYLFKAKRVDDGEWVTGSLITCEDGTCKIATSCLEGKADEPILVCAYDVDRDTICQCTGLKDKNGKLIWKNDIVNCMDAECCGYISWNESEAGFYFNVLLEDGRFEEEHIYDYQDCMEVIGNIFDNKELLESEG